jgi:hypothetical protein
LLIAHDEHRSLVAFASALLRVEFSWSDHQVRCRLCLIRCRLTPFSFGAKTSVF